MTLSRILFDTLTDGQSLANGNTATGGTITLGAGSTATGSTLHPHSGTGLLCAGASGQVSLVREALIASNLSAAANMYIWYSGTAPANQERIMSPRNGTGPACRVSITTAGKLCFENSAGTTTWTAAAALPGAGLYRIEFYGTVATTTTGTAHVGYYAGDSTTAIETWNGTAQNLGTAVLTTVDFGRVSTSAVAVSWYIDVLGTDNGAATEIGPYTAATAHVLAGSAASTSTTTGAVAAGQALAGSAASTTTTTGAVVATSALTGAATSTSSTTGAATVATTLAGSAASTSTATGSIGTTLTLAGTATSSSSTGGTITRTVPLAGSAASTSTTTGQLGATAWTLTGSAASTSTTAGAVTAARTLTGSAASTSATTGNVTASQPLTGTATTTSTTSGTLVLAYVISGTAGSITTTTGELWAALALNGSAQSVSSTTGDVTDVPPGRDITVTIVGPYHYPVGIVGPHVESLNVAGPYHYPLPILGPMESTV